MDVDVTASEVASMYWDEQMSCSEIAEQHGFTCPSSVQWFMKKHDIPRRSPGEASKVEATKRRDSPWHDKETLYHLYHEEHLSMEDIAESLGCSEETVRRQLKRHDIWIKPRRYSEPAQFYTCGDGYEKVRADIHYGQREQPSAFVHTLVTIANGADPHEMFGIDGLQVHHENKIPWDNRPSNLSVVTRDEHNEIHS